MSMLPAAVDETIPIIIQRRTHSGLVCLNCDFPLPPSLYVPFSLSFFLLKDSSHLLFLVSAIRTQEIISDVKRIKLGGDGFLHRVLCALG